MLILLLALCALGLFAAALGWYSHRRYGEEPVVEAAGCATCNGENTKCEQECMMEAAVKEIEYFDDEELDRFQGRPSDSYTEAEVELFSEVLYTLRPEETAAWCRSLTLRGIALPDPIKDDVILMIDDGHS